ncbi:MAG: AraC family transcriptional regulator [Bacteroidota bacterium]
MIVVPQAFLDNKDTKKLLRDGLNCVVYKEAKADNPNNERYVAAHALTMVLSGSLSIKTQSGDSLLVRPGQMVFLPRGLYLISDIIPDGDIFSALVCFFEAELVNEFLDTIQADLVRPSDDKPFIYPQPKQVTLFNQSMFDIYKTGDAHYNPITKHKLTELLHLVVNSEMGDAFKSTLAATRIRDKMNIGKFMEHNFDKPLKIEDYAYLTGRSISGFHRDFKRLYNTGPKQWLIGKRLEKARKRIEQDQQSNVTQVAFDAGYENISHFIKAFQKQYGVSPKQFQMNLRKQITVG